MSDTPESSGRRPAWSRLLWFLAIAVMGSGCDLQSKAWAEHTLTDLPGQSMMVADPWLEMSLSYNRGTAFSFIRDLGDARWVFGLISLMVVVLLTVAVMRMFDRRIEVFGLGAIAAGAIGNGADRLLRLTPQGDTGVVDFIKLNYPWGGSWPTFNIADVLVGVGVAALLIAAIQRRRDEAEDDDALTSEAAAPARPAGPRAS